MNFLKCVNKVQSLILYQQNMNHNIFSFFTMLSVLLSITTVASSQKSWNERIEVCYL